MASYVELFMDQGATFENKIYLTDDITNANINVAVYSFACQMRRSYYSANSTANITCSITDAANGEVTMLLDYANTSNINAGRYLFDIEMLNTSTGNKTRILEGIITVTPEITKV